MLSSQSLFLLQKKLYILIKIKLIYVLLNFKK